MLRQVIARESHRARFDKILVKTRLSQALMSSPPIFHKTSSCLRYLVTPTTPLGISEQLLQLFNPDGQKKGYGQQREIGQGYIVGPIYQLWIMQIGKAVYQEYRAGITA